MTEWQIAVSIGQLIGTVGALVWFTRNLKVDLQALQDSHNKKIETLQEKHFKLREEIAKDYLRRDEWLSHHNKLEAKLERKLDTLEKLIRGEKDG